MKISVSIKIVEDNEGIKWELWEESNFIPTCCLIMDLLALFNQKFKTSFLCSPQYSLASPFMVSLVYLSDSANWKKTTVKH